MIDQIAPFGPFLAGIAALTALMVGLTKGTRLRRREELLRASLEVTATVTESYSTIKLYHRATMAQILARQIAGPWRFVTPWLFWITSILIFGNIGYATISSLQNNPSISALDLSYEVFGEGGMSGLITTITYLLGLSYLTFYQFSAAEDRAFIAKKYFEHGVLVSMRSLKESRILDESDSKINGDGKRDSTTVAVQIVSDEGGEVESLRPNEYPASAGVGSIGRKPKVKRRTVFELGRFSTKAKDAFGQFIGNSMAFVLIALPGVVVGAISFLGGATLKARMVIGETGSAVPAYASIASIGAIILGFSLPSVSWLLLSWKRDLDARMKLFP